jgi:hypothetical protein
MESNPGYVGPKAVHFNLGAIFTGRPLGVGRPFAVNDANELFLKEK